MITKILIVDDDIDHLFLVKELLHDENFQVFSAPNGWLGFLRAKQIQPDLIISDLQMPVLNGYEFLVEVRADETLANTPFILLTSYRDRERRYQAFLLGANAYLNKPVDFNCLLTTIKEEINQKKCEQRISASCKLD